MTYFVAIPSYKRARICNEQTLATLHRMGLPKENINVFVVEEEYDEYVGELNPQFYNKIVIGKKGLIQQRAFIENYYENGVSIVSLDDDVKDIDLSLTAFTDLHTFFLQAFQDLRTHGAYLWGVYPVFNPFFRQSKADLSTELKFIVGAFYGFINRKKLFRITEFNHNKDDVERSIKYYMYDGVVLRYNKIGFETKYYANEGGLGSLKERFEDVKRSAKMLHNCFPSLCDLKVRKNGVYEVTLKRRPLVKKDDNGVITLPPISPDDINVLYELLEGVNIPYKRGQNNRRGFPVHRAVSYGFIRKRFTGKYELSSASLKNPEIYKELLNLGHSICPFVFNAIHVNNNVTCPPHKDSKNQGKSLIVSFGDYEGCKLIINGKEYDTNCQPTIFDGSMLEHYNTPLLGGNKYSIVFFNGEGCLKPPAYIEYY